MVLRDAEGRDVTDCIPGDGSAVECVEVHRDGGCVDSFERNQWGSFFRVYQPHGRWQAKRQALLAGASKEAETIML